MNSNAFAALVFCLLAMPALSAQQLYINEFLASNSTVNTDEFGENDDWVEIYNAELFAVDIGGMFVTDDLSDPAKFQIPTGFPAETTIPAGGFLLLWFDGAPGQGPLHVDAKLSASGEDIGLFTADGTLIDGLSFSAQTANVSYGRSPNGSTNFVFFVNPTPNASNGTYSVGPPAERPVASVEAGFYSNSFDVQLTTATAGGNIRYTLDGSEPDEFSQLYSGPIVVGQTTTLRARAFATGFSPSPTVTYTYLFEDGHTFPVVALSFKDADFFDPGTGIYPNYTQDWERPVNVEFFETDGSYVFSQAAVAEIQGTGSASLPQKSLRLESASDGSGGFFEHAIFSEQHFTEYKRFVLRNSGQDWNHTMFRDGFVQSLTDDISDVGGLIDPPVLFHQAFRPGVVYLNGEYWGIHNLREHMGKEYIEQHFGLSDNEIDFLDNDEVKEGTVQGWNELKAFMDQTDFTNDAAIAQLAQMVDLPHFLDYYVFNIVVDNSDWPGNNYRRWRKSPNGQWRFMTFDLDFSFGLFNHLPGGTTWNTGDASANSLARSLDDTQTTWPNPKWATRFFRKPMANDNFRKDFINRTADFLNVLFETDRVKARLDEFQQLYQPEIQRHMDRWNGGYNPFNANVDVLRKFANDRPAHMRQHVVERFAEVTGTANVTLQVSPLGGGSIEFSTINFDGNQPSWTGVYFTGIDIPVSAVPAPGFVFDGWSVAALGTDPTGFLKLSSDVILTASFSPSGVSPQPIVINEINYNSPDTPNSGDWVELYNPNNQSVSLSNWTLEDSGGGVFTIPSGTVMPPNGYLLLVENAAQFFSVYTGVGAVIGNFGDGFTGFKLSNAGELIVLRDADQTVVDVVGYEDEAPWPTEPDGNGPTLQLIEPSLENALPASWFAQAATPGKANIPVLMQQVIQFPGIPDKFTTDQPFTLQATATSGLPIEYTVVSGPVALNGNTITLNGIVGLVFIEANQPGNAAWAPAPPVVRAFRIIEPPVVQGYCGSVGQHPWHEWIRRVSFAGIDHLSGKDTYGNFTNQSALVGLSETVSLTVEPKFSWSVHDEYIRAWIDFNGDFVFSPSEMVLQAVAKGPVSADVTIPASAIQGKTRMRISMQRGQYAMPCDTFLLGEVEDYTVHIGQSVQQPQTIDFQPIGDQFVSALPFPLVATATSGLPVSFEIISGPATLSGNTLSLTGQMGTVTVRAKQPGNALWQAAPPVFRSFEVVPPSAAYCNSSGQTPWLEWIERVEFGAIDHLSFKEPYADFTHISTGAPIGGTMALRITPEHSWEEFEEYFRAWIDFNQDGDFEDVGEMVLEAIGVASVSADVTIPLGAVLGPTRLRVSMQRGQFAGPCEQFALGEVHDYSVEINDNFQDPGNDAKLTTSDLIIAPNPVGPHLNASLSIVQSGVAQLIVVNGFGIPVQRKEVVFQKGEQQLSMDVSALNSGAYLLWVRPKGQKAMVGRFVKLEE